MKTFKFVWYVFIQYVSQEISICVCRFFNSRCDYTNCSRESCIMGMLCNWVKYMYCHNFYIQKQLDALQKAVPNLKHPFREKVHLTDTEHFSLEKL